MTSFPVYEGNPRPYPQFNFQVSWDDRGVPGVFHVGPIGWVAAPGSGDGGLLESLGSLLTGGLIGNDDPAVSYTPVQLQRARTQDAAFEMWANQAANPDDSSETERVKTVEILLLDEAGAEVLRFLLRGCTPIAYVALGALDANAVGIAVETLTLSYRTFERDTRLYGPPEPR